LCGGGRGLRAFISGCEGASLTAAERRFFRDSLPCGLILFKRNCESPDQIRGLCASFRDAVGEADALVFIDQEGGRVQRLGPPHWRQYPPGGSFGALYARDPAKSLEAARAGARLIARDLRSLGITANCAPVLDVPVAGAHDVIGNRAYGSTPEQVAALGRAVVAGYLDGGVLPVIKHIPGHGRATADSHAALPVITEARALLEATDFAPFRALKDAPLGMTAHVLVTAIDADTPASASRAVVEGIIREGIGFDGLLMCDDIGMNALSGPMEERAAAVLAAGCDVVLHCSGDLKQMEAVAAVSPLLGGPAARRFEAALARLAPPQSFDEARAEELLGEVLAEIA
jgi:beta-N-acetylhexosaminidase